MSYFAPLITWLLAFGVCDAIPYSVSTSSELQAALNAAVAGDVITVSDGTYAGPFTISTSGTKSTPIILQAHGQNIKITGSGVGLTITGNYWTVKYLPFSDFDTGVVLKGSGIVLESLAVTNVYTGVDVQGAGNTVQNCAIEASKLGIHVGADNTVLQSNSIQGSNPAIFAEQRTCCGRLAWNVAGGKVKVEGQNYRSDGNIIVEGVVTGKNGGFGGKEPSHSVWSSVSNFFKSIFG